MKKIYAIALCFILSCGRKEGSTFSPPYFDKVVYEINHQCEMAAIDKRFRTSTDLLEAQLKYMDFRTLELEASNNYQATGDEKYRRQYYQYQGERVKYAKLAGRLTNEIAANK